MFMSMIDSIRDDSLGYIFRIQAIETQNAQGVFGSVPRRFVHDSPVPIRDINPPRTLSSGDIDMAMPPRQNYNTSQESAPSPIKRNEPKVGRNDACPCGSGKKYKKCCGK
jgi:preprotein translocase subunit SecA